MKFSEVRRWKAWKIVAVVFAVIAFATAVFYIAAVIVRDIRRHRLRPPTVCNTNLSGIAKAMIVYANDDPNGRLPPADKWCDLLIELDYTSPKQFVCPDSDAVVGESSFAINRHVAGKSLRDIPDDVVLIFETDQGKDPNGRTELLKNRLFYAKKPYGRGKAKVFKNRWNQSGQAEILTTQHHGGRGCKVAFMDTHVEFVKTEDLGKLRWITDANTLGVE